MPTGVFLVGAVQEQICAGKHNVRVRFDPDTSISVMSWLRLNDVDTPSEDFGQLATALCALLGQEIAAAGLVKERVPSIRIGEQMLELCDDSDRSESLVVGTPSVVFVV
jgi:hypothetical protein